MKKPAIRKPRYSELVRMLQQATDCIDEEVAASGNDDHPVLLEHAKVANRARKMIAKARGEKV